MGLQASFSALGMVAGPSPGPVLNQAGHGVPSPEGPVFLYRQVKPPALLFPSTPGSKAFAEMMQLPVSSV